MNRHRKNSYSINNLYERSTCPCSLPITPFDWSRSGMGEFGERIYEELNDMKRKSGQIKKVINSNANFDTATSGKSVCRGKCFFCCSDFFKIPEVDFMLLLWHLRENRPGEIAKYHKIASLQRELAVLMNPTIGETIKDSSTKSININTARKLPCIFLSQNGRCDMYNVRPLACRQFGTTRTCIYRNIETDTNAHIEKMSLIHERDFKTGEAYPMYPIFYWFSEFLSNENYDETIKRLNAYLSK